MSAATRTVAKVVRAFQAVVTAVGRARANTVDEPVAGGTTASIVAGRAGIVGMRRDGDPRQPEHAGAEDTEAYPRRQVGGAPCPRGGRRLAGARAAGVDGIHEFRGFEVPDGPPAHYAYACTALPNGPLTGL